MDNWWTIVIGIGILTFIYFVFVKPILVYWDWISWWNANNKDPITGQLYNCINMYTLAYYNSNYLVGEIVNSIQPIGNRFDSIGQIFFVNKLISYNGYNVFGDGKGFVVPRHLCNTLVPTDSPTIGTWPTTSDDWKSLLMGWGNFTPNQQGYYFGDQTVWASQPDNFLWRIWGIPANSSLVQDYVSGQVPPTRTGYIDALNSLLGISETAGASGWMGLLESLTGTAGLDAEEAIIQYIWATNVPKYYPITDAPPPTRCGTLNTISTVMGAGLAGSFAGAALVGAFGGPVGILAGILITAVMGSVQLGAQGCL